MNEIRSQRATWIVLGGSTGAFSQTTKSKTRQKKKNRSRVEERTVFGGEIWKAATTRSDKHVPRNEQGSYLRPLVRLLFALHLFPPRSHLNSLVQYPTHASRNARRLPFLSLRTQLVRVVFADDAKTLVSSHLWTEAYTSSHTSLRFLEP